MSNLTEFFDIVNDNGKIIGKASRSKCHNGSKLLHPVIHIHIINSEKKLLLQKRKIDKDIQPGKWDTSIGGHIISGELTEEAIKREANEELGIIIKLNKLIKLDEYIYESEIEKEYVRSYVYYYSGRIIFQESEIDEVRFFSINDINVLIKQKMVTPNFIKEFLSLKNYL
jgi:isopentenyl-diphosphate delta-isomerase type 1